LKPGSNFLEIGTYDGNTALNVGINISSESKVITIDLPESAGYGAKFEYDNWLVNNPARKQKKHLKLENVEQIYCDSTKLDFSEFSFNGAFIDGGHDFETVKSDTINVLTYIKRPGFVLWHDYDVECEVGDLLHRLSRRLPIKLIEGTRLAYLKLD